MIEIISIVVLLALVGYFVQKEHKITKKDSILRVSNRGC